MRIHAPYTHVPYHQRIDDGFVRFVNNDHCLLSARTSLRLPVAPGRLDFLPVAQTLWYVPTGLDPWNQLLGKAPGHYGARSTSAVRTPPPLPERPLAGPGAASPRRRRSRSGSTTGSRSCSAARSCRPTASSSACSRSGRTAARAARPPRLRRAHRRAGPHALQPLLHDRAQGLPGARDHRAGRRHRLGRRPRRALRRRPDMAVGPRWHSAYEMACQVAGDLARTAAILELRRPTTSAAARRPSPLALAGRARCSGRAEPAYIHESPRSCWRATSRARSSTRSRSPSAQLILGRATRRTSRCRITATSTGTRSAGSTTPSTTRTGSSCSTSPALRQPGGALGRAHAGQRRAETRRPAGAASLSPARSSSSGSTTRTMALEAGESRAWTRAYLDGRLDRAPLVQTLARAAVKEGNDPHNQEIGLCLLEDYGHSRARTATRCCSRAPTTRPATRSSATRSRPTGGSPRRSASQAAEKGPAASSGPRPQARRSRATPRLRPSGAASHLDPSRRPAALAGDIG